MSFASKRRTRIQIVSPTAGQDAAGQPLGWAPLVSLWAHVRLLSGVETIKADAQTSSVKASIRICYRRDIDASMRVVIGSDTYQINAVMPDIATHQFTDIVAELIS